MTEVDVTDEREAAGTLMASELTASEARNRVTDLNRMLSDIVPGWKYRATKAVLATREGELLKLKGACSNKQCVLHYAHSGPCNPHKRNQPISTANIDHCEERE